MPGEQQQQQGQQGQQQQQSGQQQQGQQGQQQQQAPWHGFAETDTAGVEYVEGKGWQGPQDVLKSYRSAEKLIGRDPSTLLVMPRADDPAGLLAVFDRLGRPADAAKYEFAKPKSAALDEGYVKWARGTFHKLGLTASQVKALSAEHNAYVEGIVAQRQKDYNLSVETDKVALRNEWRDGHERNMLAAESAAKRSEEHTSELQSPTNLVCRHLLEKKKNTSKNKNKTNQNTTTTKYTPN